MTARYFLKEVPGITSKEAICLKDVLKVLYPDCKKNAYYDKIKQIAFHLHKCGKRRPKIINNEIAKQVIEYSDKDWLKLLSTQEGSNSSSRQILRSLLDVDTLDDEGLAANAPLVVCRFCGGTDVAFDSQQTRSIDEGATIFFFCLNPTCLKQWTVSS